MVQTTRTAVENLAAILVGLLTGARAKFAIPQLTPIAGRGLALLAVVLIAAAGVVGPRELPALNNLLAYFLRLVAWFAAHLEPCSIELSVGASNLVDEEHSLIAASSSPAARFT